MLFQSFFLGGFECATGWNRQRQWIDMIHTTGHDRHARADYERLRRAGIRAARDGIRWPLVDRGGGEFDFSTAREIVAAARATGTAVIWDLFHFGYPAHIDPLAPDFADRFAEYCRACACFLRDELPGPLWFTPVNEPSFLAWAAGEDGQFPPYLTSGAPALKKALIRASIKGVDAIRDVLPDARFMHADPICHVLPRDDSDAAAREAQHFNEAIVFESLDMLCGRLHPELGGSRSHLDVIGLNYYWTCQWQLGCEGTWLAPDDPRRQPLRRLVERVWQRYGGELIISETAHWGDNRCAWIEEVVDECDALLDAGVPVGGLCLYPVVGMHDWHAPYRWMPMGLWDIDLENGHARVKHSGSHAALRLGQLRLEARLRFAA